jgi:hypothetical protein
VTFFELRFSCHRKLRGRLASPWLPSPGPLIQQGFPRLPKQLIPKPVGNPRTDCSARLLVFDIFREGQGVFARGRGVGSQGRRDAFPDKTRLKRGTACKVYSLP